ncbi:hypothetical protein J6590_001636 [Homalodisca vitripennis]|nr:hypothetical protein J6590_001636 [Homalodisca vitripennis]
MDEEELQIGELTCVMVITADICLGSTWPTFSPGVSSPWDIDLRADFTTWVPETPSALPSRDNVIMSRGVPFLPPLPFLSPTAFPSPTIGSLRRQECSLSGVVHFCQWRTCPRGISWI